MTFDAIADGSAVYLDANVLVYGFVGVSKESVNLLLRCKEGRVFGFVATHTIAEVCHKTMGAEAAKRFPDRFPEVSGGIPKGFVKTLKQNPEMVRALHAHAEFTEDLLLNLNLGVIEITGGHIRQAQRVRSQYGLLTNDSLTAHVMLLRGIPNLATNDSDFERIREIQVFKPSDV